MAGDWIKWEHATNDKAEVDELARILNVSHNEILGGLAKFWCWADNQTIDGRIPSSSKDDVDRHTGIPLLGDALRKVGWLKVLKRGIAVPNFSRHNGQSAKRRALNARHQQSVRNKSRLEDDESLTREEKRREEKTKEEEKDLCQISKKPLFDPRPIQDAWNKLAAEHHLPKWQRTTKKRRAAVKARIADDGWVTEWRTALDHIPQCPFLMGQTKRGKWKATPDFFLRPDSVMKILEGAYDGDNPTTGRDYRKGF